MTVFGKRSKSADGEDNIETLDTIKSLPRAPKAPRRKVTTDPIDGDNSDLHAAKKANVYTSSFPLILATPKSAMPQRYGNKKKSQFKEELVIIEQIYNPDE